MELDLNKDSTVMVIADSCTQASSFDLTIGDRVLLQLAGKQFEAEVNEVTDNLYKANTLESYIDDVGGFPQYVEFVKANVFCIYR